MKYHQILYLIYVFLNPWTAFLVYIATIASLVLALMLYFEPRYGHVNILVYLGICSLMGSLTVIMPFLLDQTILELLLELQFSERLWLIQVMSIKAIGIAIRLTLEGVSQVAYPQTWLFVTVAVVCVITQLNYLNKVGVILLWWAQLFPIHFLSKFEMAQTHD